MKEIRAFEFDVHADQNEEHGHFLSGRPIVFDQRTNLGWYDEIIDRGALGATDLKDVRFLINHNTDMIPLARSRNNNAEAKSLYSAVERGDITGMSFMFTVDKDTWADKESEHPTRTINQIGKVFEVSAVTFPAYEQTSISARGLSDALESARASLESAKAADREIERRKQKIRILMGV